MKKLISMLVASSMMIVPMCAMADAASTATEAPAADAAAADTAVADAATVAGQTEGGVDIYDMTTEIAYTGTAVEFTDDGFTLSVPEAWADGTITDDMTTSGYYAYYINEDATEYLGVQALSADEGTTPSTDEIIAMLSAEDMGYTDVKPVMFGDYTFVTYTDAANNQTGYMMVDAAGTGYVNFVFGLNDTEEMATLVPQVMSSIAATATDAAADDATAADATADDAAATEAPADTAVQG